MMRSDDVTVHTARGPGCGGLTVLAWMAYPPAISGGLAIESGYVMSILAQLKREATRRRWWTGAAAKEPAPAWGARPPRWWGKSSDRTTPQTHTQPSITVPRPIRVFCLPAICRSTACPRPAKPNSTAALAIDSTLSGSSRQVQLYPRLTDALPIGLATSTSVDQASRLGRPSGFGGCLCDAIGCVGAVPWGGLHCRGPIRRHH
jgi:hypothetical protein